MQDELWLCCVGLAEQCTGEACNVQAEVSAVAQEKRLEGAISNKRANKLNY